MKIRLANKNDTKNIMFFIKLNWKDDHIFAINQKLKSFNPMVIDRIAPLGRTMDFDLYWDGYELIQEMSKKINLVCGL